MPQAMPMTQSPSYTPAPMLPPQVPQTMAAPSYYLPQSASMLAYPNFNAPPTMMQGAPPATYGQPQAASQAAVAPQAQQAPPAASAARPPVAPRKPTKKKSKSCC